jgi:hypothetical protein
VADVVPATDGLDRVADAGHLPALAPRRAERGGGHGPAARRDGGGGVRPAAVRGWRAAAGGDRRGGDRRDTLRALGGGRDAGPTTGPRGLLRRFAAEHDALRDQLDPLRERADKLAAGPSAELLPALRRVHRVLADCILRSKRADEAKLYPALAAPLGGEATGPIEPRPRRDHPVGAENCVTASDQRTDGDTVPPPSNATAVLFVDPAAA